MPSDIVCKSYRQNVFSCTREGYVGSQVAQPLSQLCRQSCTRLPLCSLRLTFNFLLISIHSLHFFNFYFKYFEIVVWITRFFLKNFCLIDFTFLKFLIVFLFNHTKKFLCFNLWFLGKNRIWGTIYYVR